MHSGLLGAGSYGAVHHALWHGAEVAIKCCKQLYDEDSSHFKSPEMARATFIQEMEAMSRLRHPNIILFLGATDSLTPIIVTEYAARGALDKLLSTK